MRRTSYGLITTPIDRALWADLGALVGDVTSAFASYDYSRALERTERFFWSFCDDYPELGKTRAHGPDDPKPPGPASGGTCGWGAIETSDMFAGRVIGRQTSSIG